MDKRITNAFAVVILIAWGVSFILQALVEGYDPPDSVNILATMLGGAVFGANTLASVLTKKTGKESTDNGTVP